jgi:transposase
VCRDSLADRITRDPEPTPAPARAGADNASDQKRSIVTALALQLNIELLYLPAYSPNLNLIERLWKFVKKKVLDSRYYANFSDFRNAITDCLNQTHTTHKQELDSLFALNF